MKIFLLNCIIPIRILLNMIRKVINRYDLFIQKTRLVKLESLDVMILPLALATEDAIVVTSFD